MVKNYEIKCISFININQIHIDFFTMTISLYSINVFMRKKITNIYIYMFFDLISISKRI